MKVHQRAAAGDDGKDRAVALLAAQVDKLRQEVTGLTEAGTGLRSDVDAHTRTLNDLSDLLRRVSSNDHPEAGEGDESVITLEWMTVTDPAQAIEWLTTLSVWVRDVYRRYSPVPDCWPWHPPAVAELLACNVVWAAAFGEDGSPEATSAWHDR